MMSIIAFLVLCSAVSGEYHYLRPKKTSGNAETHFDRALKSGTASEAVCADDCTLTHVYCPQKSECVNNEWVLDSSKYEISDGQFLQCELRVGKAICEVSEVVGEVILTSSGIQIDLDDSDASVSNLYLSNPTGGLAPRLAEVDHVDGALVRRFSAIYTKVCSAPFEPETMTNLTPAPTPAPTENSGIYYVVDPVKSGSTSLGLSVGMVASTVVALVTWFLL